MVVKPAGATDAVAEAEGSKPSQNAQHGFDLGFAASSAGSSDAVGQPVDFGGMVPARCRYGIWTNGYPIFGCGSGYHGSFGRRGANLTGLVGGYDATPTIYNGAFGWLAASMTFKDIEVLWDQ